MVVLVTGLAIIELPVLFERGVLGSMEAIGKTSDYVHDPFNIFMKTGVNSDGISFWEASDAVKGDYIDLKAEMKCIVAISACPGMSSGRVGHLVGIEIYSPEGA